MNNNFTDGILLVNKPTGKTSFQIISELRKIIGIKKIGHAGTLDKSASGLLLIGVGRATKLLKYFVGFSKEYTAEIFFGKQTATDDSQGSILHEFTGQIDPQLIYSHLKAFNGKIHQIPPNYSAVHVDGRRAYKLAVKKQEVTLKPREVEIYNTQIISMNNNILKVSFSCSSGTYIRSIARDLGILTGYYGYLYSLVRTKINNYQIDESYTLDNISNNNFKMISPFNALVSLPSLEIKMDCLEFLKNGKIIDENWFCSLNKSEGLIYKVHTNGQLLALIKCQNEKLIYDIVF